MQRSVEGHAKLSAEIQSAIEKGVDPDKSWVMKRKRETAEKKAADPVPENKFKYSNPFTGQEHEGTAAEREAQMKWR